MATVHRNTSKNLVSNAFEDFLSVFKSLKTTERNWSISSGGELVWQKRFTFSRTGSIRVI